MWNINFILAVALMAITGLIDGQAFSRIPLMWKHHGVDLVWEVGKTLAIFNLGLFTQFASTYFFYQQGIDNALVLTLIWFAIAVVAIAVVSGGFVSLSTTDKIISVAAIVLIGVLYIHGVAE